MYYKCRDYQEEALDKIKNWLDSDIQNGCLAFATGMGKTKVALEAAARYSNKPVVWVTHKITLLDQSGSEELIKPIYNEYSKDYKIGYLKGDKIDDLSDKNIIFVSASLLEDNEKGFITQLKDIDPEMVIIDEAHNNREVYEEIRKEFKTLNLTATPFDAITLERKDLGEDLGFIPYKEAVERDVCMDVTFAQLDIQAILKDFSSVWKDVQSEETLNLILDNVEPYIKNEPTLMCLKNLKEVTLIQDVLKKRGLKYGVISSNKKEDLKNNEGLVQDPDNYRSELLSKLSKGEIDGLLNYDVLIEGIDVPELSRVINFRPLDTANKFAQLVGRLARKSKGKSNALFIDVANTPLEQGNKIFLDVVKGRKEKHMAAILHNGDPSKISEEDIFEHSHYNINDIKEFYKTGLVPKPINSKNIEESNTIKIGNKEIKFRELDFDKEDIIYLPKGIPINEDIDALKQRQSMKLKPLYKSRENILNISNVELFKDLCESKEENGELFVRDKKISFVKQEDKTAILIDNISIFCEKGTTMIRKSRGEWEEIQGDNKESLKQILNVTDSVINKCMSENVSRRFSEFIKKNNSKGLKKSFKNGIVNSSLFTNYDDYINKRIAI